MDALFQGGDGGTFTKVCAVIGKRKPDMWLPESLLKKTIKRGGDIKQWSLIQQKHRQVQLKYTPGEGPVLIGSFSLGRKITITVKTTRPATKPTVKRTATGPKARN
jgi:hypothetical protein